MYCKDLERAWKWAKIDKRGYYVVNSILYHKKKFIREMVRQLLVPKIKKEGILRSVNASGKREHHTAKRIRQSFWENKAKEVKNFANHV